MVIIVFSPLAFSVLAGAASSSQGSAGRER